MRQLACVLLEEEVHSQFLLLPPLMEPLRLLAVAGGVDVELVARSLWAVGLCFVQFFCRVSTLHVRCHPLSAVLVGSSTRRNPLCTNR